MLMATELGKTIQAHIDETGDERCTSHCAIFPRRDRSLCHRKSIFSVVGLDFFQSTLYSSDSFLGV